MPIIRGTKVLPACALALMFNAGHAADAGQAQNAYPSRPVEIIVAYPPGGGTDILTRLVAEQLSLALKQPVLVVNRGGASGAIGTEAAARAKPDGYTLLMGTSNVTISPAIDAKTRFNPTRDFVPVALLSESPFVLAANAALPVRDFADLVAYSRQHEGEINYASTGTGSPQHLATELLCKLAGLQWVHIPYQGGAPAVADLLAGHVQVMLSNVLPVQPYLKGGKAKPLAVTTQDPLPALPQVPTLASQGQPDMVISFWTGLLAPAGTAPAIVSKLEAAVLQIMEKPEIRDKLIREGSVVRPMASQDFARYIAQDAAHWKRVAQTTQISVQH